MRALLRTILLFAASAGAARAADVYEIDPLRSHAEFEVKVMWLVNVRGTFGAVKGHLTIDRFRGTAKVDADIDANVLHMRTQGYESWAKSNEFFDSEHFPNIRFVSDSFPVMRVSTGGDVDGALTLRGVEQPIRLHLEKPECDDPLTGACSVEAFGAIRRGEFGMQSHRGALSDKVQLRLSAFVTAVADNSRP